MYYIYTRQFLIFFIFVEIYGKIFLFIKDTKITVETAIQDIYRRASVLYFLYRSMFHHFRYELLTGCGFAFASEKKKTEKIEFSSNVYVLPTREKERERVQSLHIPSIIYIIHTTGRDLSAVVKRDAVRSMWRRIAGLQIACPRKVEGEHVALRSRFTDHWGKSRLCRGGGSGNAGSCVGRIRHMRALRVARRGIVS